MTTVCFSTFMAMCQSYQVQAMLYNMLPDFFNMMSGKMYNKVRISIQDNPVQAKVIKKLLLKCNPTADRVRYFKLGVSKDEVACGNYVIDTTQAGTGTGFKLNVTYTPTELIFTNFIIRKNNIPQQLTGIGFNGTPNKIYYYEPEPHHSTWTKRGSRPYEKISPTRYTPELRTLLADVQAFKSATSKKPTQGYLLYGKSGTGKTSFATVVAELYNMPVYCMSFGDFHMTADRFTALIREVPKRSVLFFDEFDKKLDLLKALGSQAPMNIGKILEVLRGATPLPQGTIVVLAANNVDFLDDEHGCHLVSPGRIDILQEMKTKFYPYGIPATANYVPKMKVSAPVSMSMAASMPMSMPASMSMPAPLSVSTPATSTYEFVLFRLNIDGGWCLLASILLLLLIWGGVAWNSIVWTTPASFGA